MKARVRIAILALTLLIVIESQISLSLASYSSSQTVVASGNIVYSEATYIVSTLTELTSVLSKVVPGDVVWLRGGIYQPTSQITFQRSGSSGNPITYEAYPNEQVVFDGSLKAATAAWDPLIGLSGNWITLRNVEVRNHQGAGVTAYGDDCVLENIEAHHNAGAGLNSFGDRCQFLRCIAHDNIDPQSSIPGGDADGMGASSPATGCYFFGCVAYANSDDGIDVYGSSYNVIANCVCYDNGRLDGDGNGIKLTGSGYNKAINCIVYNNMRAGFSVEQDSPANELDHCTAYNNAYTGFMEAYYNDRVYTNNLGIITKYLATPTEISNSWNLGITNYGFISTDPASPDFLSLRADSLCRGKASGGSDLGALQYGERISDLLGT